MTDEKFMYAAKKKVMESLGEVLAYNSIQMTRYAYRAGEYRAMFVIDDRPDCRFEVNYVKNEDKFEVNEYAGW